MRCCCRNRPQRTDLEGRASFVGSSHKLDASSPEENANLLSRLLVCWMIEPLSIARKKNLKVEDFGPLAQQDKVEVVYDRFMTYFEEADRNLSRALIRLVTYRVLIVGFMLTLLQAASNIAVPFLTKAILNSLTGQIPLTTGQLWGVTIGSILCPFVGAVCQAHVLLLSRRASLHLFLALTHAIFTKSLSKADISVGRATNLIANDAGVSMERSIQMFFPLLVSPFQLAILLWLLYCELGVAVFAGIGTVFLILPLNIFIFSRISVLNTRIMKTSDFRQKLVNEFLMAIRVVKAYAWEEPLLEKIEISREEQLKAIKSHAITLNVGLGLVFIQMANVMQVVVLWTYFGLGGIFSPSIIFPAVQLFALIQSPLSSLPNAISSGIQTRVAVRRIEAFLNEPNLEDHSDDQRLVAVAQPQPDEVLIEIEGASFAWRENQDQEEKREPFVLRNVSLKLHRGSLVAVVSKLGGGKTSFLKAILGEMSKQTGRIVQKGTVAFAQQDPFIVNGTLRDNILFGLDFDEDRYFMVIDGCALTEDLAMLKGGDLVEIGERGINLSGGQMARISLARVLYSKSDIVLLDDPLSAVDSHVGDKLFETFRTSSLLKGRLAVLVTNQVLRLKHVDKIVSIGENGAFVGCDTFEGISKRNIDIEADDGCHDLQNGEKNHSSTHRAKIDDEDAIYEREKSGVLLAKQASSKALEEVPENLFELERTRSGEMSLRVFRVYLKSAGYVIAAFAAFTCACYMVLPSLGQIVISYLTNAQVKCGATKCPDQEIVVYLSWYTFTIVLSLILCVVSGAMMALMRVRSARTLHHALIGAISRASIAFFDATPIGRISNRFAKDIAMIDTLLSQYFLWVCITISIVLGSIISVAVATKGVFLGIVIPVFFGFFVLFRFQRVGGAAIHRIEGTTRGPIYSLFAETLNGRCTIRAFQQQNRFSSMNMQLLERNAVPFFLGRTGLPAFLTTFLNIIGFFSTASVTLFVVFGGVVSASDAGLALSSVSAIVATLYFCVFMFQDFELQLSAVERIDIFINGITDWELPYHCPQNDPPAIWPTEGSIIFSHLSVGYRKGPDVLKDITLEIKPSEKIGVVGRTGSGKSTMLRVLLRLCEPRRGTVFVDGVDIGRIGLSVLRSRVGIIPQEPVLFSETVRYNLDPFKVHSDSDVFDVLDLVGLGDFIRNMSLDYVVSEGGANFSQGQRQLLCVVRALLRRTTILLLDEPSASIDHESDQILQQTIRTAFKTCTTVTVAHRLSSIADSDKVLVLSQGEIVEFDAPLRLLSKPDGHFRGMVNVLEDSEMELCQAMAQAAWNASQKHGEGPQE